jgi:hypothetical protein
MCILIPLPKGVFLQFSDNSMTYNVNICRRMIYDNTRSAK